MEYDLGAGAITGQQVMCFLAGMEIPSLFGKASTSREGGVLEALFFFSKWVELLASDLMSAGRRREGLCLKSLPGASPSQIGRGGRSAEQTGDQFGQTMMRCLVASTRSSSATGPAFVD